MSGFQINHIAIVVSDMPSALGFWRDALGLSVERLEQNEIEKVDIAFLPIGESEIELISPTSSETGVGRYLAKTGGGLHHICLEVPDINAALESLAAARVELINATPRTRDDGTRYAFVHPSSTGGVLLELYELPVTGATASVQ
ncbi:MAG: methylmalonyl-CoA epimerase [Chloroflexi bacterium]|nr:methylmalonyl-CoA epimerase [Chloroflexota bacterium]